MSTHSNKNLCFGSKIRKLDKPLQTPVFYVKVGFKGVYIARTCFPDVPVVLFRGMVLVRFKRLYHRS